MKRILFSVLVGLMLSLTSFAQSFTPLAWTGNHLNPFEQTVLLDSTWSGVASVKAYTAPNGRLISSLLQPTVTRQGNTLFIRFTSTANMSNSTYVTISTGSIVRRAGYLSLGTTSTVKVPEGTDTGGVGTGIINTDMVQGLPLLLAKKVDAITQSSRDLGQDNQLAGFGSALTQISNGIGDPVAFKAVKDTASVAISRANNAITGLFQRVYHVADIATLQLTPGTNLASVVVRDKLRGGTFAFDPSLSNFDYGVTFPAFGGGGWTLQLSGRAVTARDFGAKGDGSTNDTQLIQAALNSSYSTVRVEGGTYLVDEITVPSGKTLEISVNATLKARGVTNTVDRAIVHLMANAKLIGPGTIDGNAPGLNSLRTNVWANNYAISVDGDNAKIESLTIKNAFTSLVASNKKGLIITNYTDIGTGRGPSLIRCTGARINNITVQETNMVYAGIYQHCFDVMYSKNVQLSGLKILNVNGAASAPSITISGLTLLGNQDSVFENLLFDGFLSTVHDGLPLPDDGSQNCVINNVIISGWKYGVGMEVQGSHGSTYSNILIDGTVLSNTTSGSVGIHILDTAISGGFLDPSLNEWQSRDRATASRNIFSNIRVIGGYAGFRVAGSFNQFTNCTATGQMYGWRIQQLQGGVVTNVWRNSIIQNIEDNTFTDCGAVQCQFGIAYWGGKGNQFYNPRLINCVYGVFNQSRLVSAVSAATSTGISLTTAQTANAFKGYQIHISNGAGVGQMRTIVSHTATDYVVSPAWTIVPDATSEAVIVDNPQGPIYLHSPVIKDNQAFTLSGAASFPLTNTNPASLTAITLTRGAEQINYNQKIKLKNVIAGATNPDLIVRVTSLDKSTRDRLYVTPISLGDGSTISGTLAPTLITGTGTVTTSNFPAVVGTTLGRMVGSGTNFPAEIDGHFWVRVNNEWKQVLQAIADSEYWFMTPITTTATGVNYQYVAVDVEGIPSMVNGISFNRHNADVVIDGQIEITGNSGVAINNFRSRSANSVELTPNSTTPSIAVGSLFKTNNSASTSITGFSGGYEGKAITVQVQDANTTFLFTAGTLKGYSANYTANIGDVLTATYNGTYWLCSIAQAGGRWKAWEFGDPAQLNPVLSLYGGSTGSDFMRFIRTSGSTNTFGFAIAGGFFGIRDQTNGGIFSLGTQYTGTTKRVVAGLDNATSAIQGEFSSESITGVATDAQGARLLVSSGRGTGAGAASVIEFYTPNVGTSGTTQQARTAKVQINSLGIILTTVPTYADNAAATAANLAIGQIYKTATGQLMIRY